MSTFLTVDRENSLIIYLVFLMYILESSAYSVMIPSKKKHQKHLCRHIIKRNQVVNFDKLKTQDEGVVNENMRIIAAVHLYSQIDDHQLSSCKILASGQH